jgi:hypothetical protein
LADTTCLWQADQSRREFTKMEWIYVSECLYRKCKDGTIYIRTQINGKRTLRSTQTTKPTKAKRVPQRLRDETWFERYGETLFGPQVRSRKLTVKVTIASYVKVGFPTKKMRKKAPETIKKEVSLIRSVELWWGNPHPGGFPIRSQH